MLNKIKPDALASVITKAVLEALNTLDTQSESKTVQPQGETLTPREFGKAVGIGINQVHDYCRAKRIKHVKFGERNIKIPRSEITDFLEREAQLGDK